MHVSIVGVGIVVCMALIYDANGTVSLVVAVIGVRGITWLVQKITGGINQDASQIIDFAGWSIAGVNITRIIGNAMGSVVAIKSFVADVGAAAGKISEFVDKIVFWS